MHKIIATGSKGNAVIYFGSILVDCGVPYSFIRPYVKDIQIVLLTHEHHDHLNIATLKKMAFDRPSVRFGCGNFLAKHLDGIRNVDVYQSGVIYSYDGLKICPITLYHDVPNYGYRIFKDGKKILHATDSYTLDGISAKGYDLYALECNYDDERVYDIIEEKRMNGQFAHQIGSVNSHLSIQQAQNFVLRNAGEKYQFVQLHASSEF